jgi:HPt (histidine-containing phosphotransfer) domain-containing protein
MADDPQAQELLARLRDRYLESVSGKSDALALLLCRCLAEEDNEHSWCNANLSHPDESASPVAPRSNAAGETSLAQATRLAHSMVGSGASYGFPGITAHARIIEEALSGLPSESVSRLAALFDALFRALQLREDIRRTVRGERPLKEE